MKRIWKKFLKTRDRETRPRVFGYSLSFSASFWYSLGSSRWM